MRQPLEVKIVSWVRRFCVQCPTDLQGDGVRPKLSVSLAFDKILHIRGRTIGLGSLGAQNKVTVVIINHQLSHQLGQ